MSNLIDLIVKYNINISVEKREEVDEFFRKEEVWHFWFTRYLYPESGNNLHFHFVMTREMYDTMGANQIEAYMVSELEKAIVGRDKKNE